MTIKEFLISLGFDIDDSKLEEADKKVKKTGKDAEKTGNELDSLTSIAKKLGTALVAAFSISAIKNFASECVQLASDVEQTNQKFEAVFGNVAYEAPTIEMDGLLDQYSDMTKSAESWAETQAEAWGRSKNKIKTYLADEQNMLYGLGSSYFDSEEEARIWSTNLSEEMTGLAMDIASFANLDEDSAINYMTKAVMGQTEAARMLGAVLDDNAKSLAMEKMGLTGTYDSLDQATKMLVNYNAILNQSTDAVGDMQLSLDNELFESKSRKAAAAMEELKETIGTSLLPLFTALQGITYDLAKGLTNLAEAILIDEKGENRLQKITEKLNIWWNKMRDAIGRLADFLKKLADRVGGVGNLLKILATALGAFFVVLKFDKIIKFIKAFKKLSSVFSLANLKILAIVACIVVLFLLIEDFVGFLQGKDSMIGKILADAGMDVDGLREGILGTVAKIKAAVQTVIEWVQAFWSEHGEAIMAGVKLVIEKIYQYIVMVVSYVNVIIQFIKGLFTGDWTGLVEALKSLWNSINEFFGGIPEKALQWGKDFIQGLIDGITSMIDTVVETVSGVADKIASFLHFTAPDEGPLADYETWMPDFMKGLSDGIENNKSLLTDKISELASNVSMLFQSATAQPQTVSNGAVSNNNSSVTQNVNISNSYTGQSTDGSKAVRNTMKKSAADATSQMARALQYAR